jgi:hypothetical protein
LQLREISVDATKSGNLTEEGQREHAEQYLQIRDIVRNHINSGERPQLKLSVKPYGSYEWIDDQPGYFNQLVAENAAYKATYEGGALQNMQLGNEWIDDGQDTDWAQGEVDIG